MRRLSLLVVLVVLPGCPSGPLSTPAGPRGVVLSAGLTGTVDLGDVPPGCGRHDVLSLTASSPMRITSVTSSNPAVTAKAPNTAVDASDVPLVIDLEAPAAGAGFLRSVITVSTDDGAALSFEVQTLVATLRPLTFDFGGIPVYTYASTFLPHPAPLSALQPNSSFAFGSPRLRGEPDVTGGASPRFRLTGNPIEEGHYADSALLNVYRHCPGFEALQVQFDGVAAALTPTSQSVDFGDVVVGTTATRQVTLENWSSQPLRPGVSASGIAFTTGLDLQTLAPATRDDAGVLHPSVTTVELQFKPMLQGPHDEVMSVNAEAYEVAVSATFTVRGAGVP